MRLRASIISLLAVITLSAAAQFHLSRRYAIEPAKIARAIVEDLSRRGISVDASAVSLPANVVAAEPDPLLELNTMHALPHAAPTRQRASIRIACHMQGACLPFFAIVTLDGPDALAKFAGASAPQKRTHTVTMPKGTHATLVLEDNGTRIVLPVVTLQDGGTGETIRVAAASHRVYNASVENASLLKAGF